MKRPTLGVLVFIAVAGLLSLFLAVTFVPSGHSASLGISFAAGIALLLSLYLYDSAKWHAAALGRLVHESPPSQRVIAHVSAAGAVVGPVAVAVLSAYTGWSKNLIFSCAAMWLSGFMFSLVLLWVVLLKRYPSASA